jgi:hypothetical protein
MLGLGALSLALGAWGCAESSTDGGRGLDAPPTGTMPGSSTAAPGDGNASAPASGGTMTPGVGSGDTNTGSSPDAADSGPDAAGTAGTTPDAAGTTPPGDDAMMGGGAGMAAPDPMTTDGDYMPACVSDPSQVVIVGDSYINWGTHSLPADLARESGQTWRLFAVGGASLASGGATGFIPDQFELAIADDPDIRVVVMDGGGNDVLIPNALFVGSQDCKNDPDAGNVEVCRMIVDLALEKSEEMMLRAAEIGVTDTVYFFYPEVPEGTVLGGTNPNAILNYSLPKAREQCESAFELTGGRMRCHFVDMIPVFAGHSEYFAAADIHPNTMGSAAMAAAIWDVMVDACVAQPESSGCCRP